MNQKTVERKDNPAHRQWRLQVWANYHYGKMSIEAAEQSAGAEPPRWIEVQS